MKEKDVLKKLTLLKQVGPKHSVLKNIKRDVYAQVQTEYPTSIQQRVRAFFAHIPSLIAANKLAAFGMDIAVALILFVSTASVVFPTQTHTVFLYTRIASASNQYEKARIALSDTKERFAGNNLNMTDMQGLSQSLALTNTQLSNLKLKGEKGKYTAQECHTIYQEYLTFLEHNEQALSTTNSQSTSKVKSQMHTYEEQAEQKLHMYKSL